MSTEERFLRYCRIDTQSDESSTTSPSTMKQKDLAEVLVQELQQMGIADAHMDEYGYVYAHIASNIDHVCANVGFIAHMDTAPEYSGTGVNPRVIEKYDGSDIVLCDDAVQFAFFLHQSDHIRNRGTSHGKTCFNILLKDIFIAVFC